MPTNRMERFTQRARRVLSLAQEEAESLHHDQIGTEHILLGLIREEGSIAGRVLRDLGIQYAQVRSVVRDSNKSSTSLNLDLAVDTKSLLEVAVDEARRHRHNFIGTEHLLMALTRQTHSKAYATLQHLNINTKDVYQRASKLLFDDETTTFPAFSIISMLAILNVAQQAALQLNNPLIEPEHLLLALLIDPDGSATRLIEELNFNRVRIHDIIRKLDDKSSQTPKISDAPSLSQKSQALLQLTYLPFAHFPDRLLMALVRDWWILSDLWKQVGLKPEQLQEALNRAQIGVEVMTFASRDPLTIRQELQLHADFLFPPPLRRALWTLFLKVKTKLSGTNS